MSSFTALLTLSLCVLFSVLQAVVAVPVAASAPSKRGLSGTATYFAVGLGACGDTNVDSDWIVALATNTYAGGSHCNQNVVITDNSSGKTATATVKDECPSCADGDLDMSQSLFEYFRGSTADGVFDMSWDFA
ncbi:hypothetical protein CYLTODRAFT_395906 [Cylindrobasidium torrendii FP15055 ss-10]|uniref:RlpA-like protein double-psi beta-barrel domain-containing protein n=1 Tax=Cylindrobasidium torrendii FP15055 ss-10 TaxID=1314674 RepID=A0A0D7BD24_9AGAR|nr:hypothetical protein CYLTODRAFT_395906 [Cylindrobasidium torrendii FP15055 ss-10]